MKVIFKDPENERYFRELDNYWLLEFPLSDSKKKNQPTDEQKIWIRNRMKGSARSWKRWYE